MTALYALFYAISGFCVLALETIWIRELGLRIGSTVESATLVICVFFLCAAAGNLAGGRWSAHSARPARLYGLLEILTALAALAAFALRNHLPAPHAESGAARFAAHFVYSLALAGPASFFAGTTFPALSEAFIRHVGERARTGAWFYALNLIGAAGGVLAGGLWLPLNFGFAATFYAVAGLLFLAGVAAAALGSRVLPAPPVEPERREKRPKKSELAAPDFEIPFGAALVVLIGSGFLSLVLEILCLNYFQLMASSSIYSVTAILFAYIVNLGVGALAVAMLRCWTKSTRLLGFTLLAAAGLAVLYPFILHGCLNVDILPARESASEFGWQCAAAATFLLLPLLLAVGAVFPLAWEVVERGAAHQGSALGHIVSANKFGAAVGAAAAPFLLVPLTGLPGAFLVVAGGYALLALLVSTRTPRNLASIALLGASIAGAAFLLQPPVRVPPHEKLLALYSGSGGITAVTEDPTPSRHIVSNQTYTLNGTNRALLSQQHQSWLPLALSPDPKRVLYIGLASGSSAGAALDFPLDRLVTAELIPEVARAAHEYFSAWNNNIFTDPRSHIVVNDGRYVLATSAENFDLVICDLLLPSQEGASNLFSRDFFERVVAQLAPGGRFCLWLPTYQMDEAIAGSIVNSFLSVFSCAIALRGNFDPEYPIVGLLGSREKFDLSAEFLAARVDSAAVQRLAARSPFLRSAANLRLTLLGDLHTAREYFARFTPTTDDYPAVAFQAARRLRIAERLNGITLLKWSGNRFLLPYFPSCDLKATPPDELINGIRAGNNYFAASVMAVQMSDFGEQLQRDARKAEYLRIAREVLPAARIEASDLGR